MADTDRGAVLHESTRHQSRYSSQRSLYFELIMTSTPILMCAYIQYFSGSVLPALLSEVDLHDIYEV